MHTGRTKFTKKNERSLASKRSGKREGCCWAGHRVPAQLFDVNSTEGILPSSGSPANELPV